MPAACGVHFWALDVMPYRQNVNSMSSKCLFFISTKVKGETITLARPAAAGCPGGEGNLGVVLGWNAMKKNLPPYCAIKLGVKGVGGLVQIFQALVQIFQTGLWGNEPSKRKGAEMGACWPAACKLMGGYLYLSFSPFPSRISGMHFSRRCARVASRFASPMYPAYSLCLPGLS